MLSRPPMPSPARECPSAGSRSFEATAQRRVAASMRQCARMLVQSPWFQALWPLAPADDQDAKSKFENEHRGWRMASSVGGVGTGERADRLIIDDPHAVADANSPA